MGFWSLWTEEVKYLHAAGLSILPIQYKPRSSDNLNSKLGRQWGEYHAKMAARLSVPRGVHLFCDLEGKATYKRQNMSDNIKYCVEFVHAWAQQVINERYKAGLYLSKGLPYLRLRGLPSQYSDLINKLSAIPEVTCYWRSLHADLPEPKRGYSIFQGNQITLEDKRRWFTVNKKSLEFGPPPKGLKGSPWTNMKRKRISFPVDPDIIVKNPPNLWRSPCDLHQEAAYIAKLIM